MPIMPDGLHPWYIEILEVGFKFLLIMAPVWGARIKGLF